MKYKITSLLLILFFSFFGISFAKDKAAKPKKGTSKQSGKHHKNYVPIVYEWEKNTKTISLNQPVVITVKMKALRNLKDIVVTASLNPSLILGAGSLENKFDQWEAGETKTIQYTVIPIRNDKYELAVHCSVVSGEERMGSVEVYEFVSSDFQMKKQENIEKSGDQEYSVLPGSSE